MLEMVDLWRGEVGGKRVSFPGLEIFEKFQIFGFEWKHWDFFRDKFGPNVLELYRVYEGVLELGKADFKDLGREVKI